MGYKDGQRKPQPTEEQLAWAADLYADGQSRKEVHRTTGISIFFLTKYFPNDKWTPQEAGAHAVLLAKERRISDRIQK